jgi:hypothetical protein
LAKKFLGLENVNPAIDPQAWLADIFARIATLPQGQLHELLPWVWKQRSEAA